MAVTYTWANAESTQLKYVDDSTTPDTEKYVPVAAGNRDYNEYVAWVALGNVATAYVAPGYEDTATAKTTRTAEISSQATSEIEQLYGEAIKRSQLASKRYFSNPYEGNTHCRIRDLFKYNKESNCCQYRFTCCTRNKSYNKCNCLIFCKTGSRTITSHTLINNSNPHSHFHLS